MFKKGIEKMDELWEKVTSMGKAEAFAQKYEWRVIMRGRRTRQGFLGFGSSKLEATYASADERSFRSQWQSLSQSGPFDVIEIRPRWVSDPEMDIALSRTLE